MYMLDVLKEPLIVQQRKDERVMVTWHVVGRWKDGSSFSASTVNISKSGIMISSPVQYKEGERAYIKFHAMLSGEKRWIDAVIEIKHQVLTSKGKYNIGASFIRMTQSNKAFISSYIEKQVKNKPRSFHMLFPNEVKHVREQDKVLSDKFCNSN